MITITDKAIAKVKEISEAEGIGYCIVRAKIFGGGCNGYQFDLSFDDFISDADEIFDTDGVKVICDQVSFQYMDGITIDYLETDFGGGFSFVGGNIKGSCGCGNSVNF